MTAPANPSPSSAFSSRSGIDGCTAEVQELTDAIPLPLWIGDEQGRTIYLNRAWRHFSGRPVADDLGDGWFDLVHPMDRALVRAHRQELLRTGGPLRCDFRLRRADGEYRLVRERSQARYDSAGGICGFTGTRADVTEGYEAEKRLTLETLRQSALINFGRRTLDDPPLAELAQEATRTLADTLAVPCSLLLLRLTAEGPMELLGSTGLPDGAPAPLPAGDVATDAGHLVLPDDMAAFPVPESWRSLHGFHGGFAVPIGEGGRVDGFLIGLTLQAEPPAGANLLFARNLTHFVQTMLVRDRARAAQRESSERALQSQKMEAVGLLAGGVAHDFNNLLTAIRCFGELLRDDLTQDADRAKMDDILHAANHASHLVRQLLTFSRKHVQEPENIEVSQLLDDLRSFIRSLLSENIALEIKLADEPAYIRADRNQIEQVIFNLCLNARDAMPGGGRLTLSVARRELAAGSHERLEAGRYVEIRISDSGCGIPPDVQKRVFEPFFTTKGHGRGTGLGLSTCVNICRAAGGDIALRSTVGVGTEFTLLLPETIVTDEFVNEEETPALNPGTGRILVVDDDDLVRAVTTSLLEALGYQVVTLPSSDAALEYAASGDFQSIQILVTDIVMPGLNGHELARRLSALNPKMKTLFMSGYIDDPAIQTAILDPGVMFLAKPFSTAELAERIAKLMA